MADLDKSDILRLIYSAATSFDGVSNFDSTVGDAKYASGVRLGQKVGNFGNGIINTVYEIKKELIDLSKQMAAKQAQIVSAKLDLINKTVETYMGSMTGGLTANANRVINQQAKKMLELARTRVHEEYAINYAKQAIGVAKLKVDTNIAKSISMINQTLIDTGIKLVGSAAETIVNSKGGTYLMEVASKYATGSAVGELIEYFNGGELAQDIGSVVGTMFGGSISNEIATILKENIPLAIGIGTGFLQSMNSMLFNFQRQEMQIRVEMAELNLEVTKQAQEIAEKYIQSMENLVKPWIDIVDKMQEAAEKFDTGIRRYIVTTGYIGAQGDTYVKSQLGMAEHIALTFGKNYEDMMRLTSSYQQAAGGRQVNMSQAAYDTQFSTGRLFGMEDGEVANLYGGMNIFNTSIESAGDRMEKMYKTITKMGLSTAKFGKDLTENLKKAQKYNFKGGVENMMKLTKWAQQTRFNLDAATGFSDKLLGGTLANAIEASAKLQVLGGAAAIYSDPLGMIYDAGADVGALAKRQASMFSDLSGTFNSKTGETDFSWYENYMIKQRAAAAGMSEEDAKNMIRQSNKQGVIDKVLKGYNIDSDTKTAIGNRATYNQRNGQWEVTDIRGETHNIKEYASGLRSINDLLPENNDEAMLKIAEKSLGFEEQQTNFQKAIMLRFASAEYDKIVDESRMNLQSFQDLYSNPNIYHMLEFMMAKSGELGRSSNTGMNEMLNSPEYFNVAENYFTGTIRNTSDINEKVRSLVGPAQAYAKSNGALLQLAYNEIDPGIKSMDDALRAGNAMFEQSMKDLPKHLENFVTESINPIVGTVNRHFTTLATQLGEKGAISKKIKELVTPLTKIGDNLEVKNAVNSFKSKEDKENYKTLEEKAKSLLNAQCEMIEAYAHSRGITFDAKSRLLNDGVGLTNGGYITGASNVKSIEDGSGITGTSKYDQFLVAKSGGPVDKLFDGVIGGINELSETVNNGGSGNGKRDVTVNLVISGSLDLEGNGSYDIIKELKTNDIFAKNMASVLARNITGAVSDNSDKGRFNWGSV